MFERVVLIDALAGPVFTPVFAERFDSKSPLVNFGSPFVAAGFLSPTPKTPGLPSPIPLFLFWANAPVVATSAITAPQSSAPIKRIFIFSLGSLGAA